jgi:DNA-binding NarL/FixJ family response regulator
VEPAQPITCLIAEDHDLMRQALAAWLRADPGVELLGAASDGEALLELVEQHRPRVVVADARMPRLDGLGVCRAVAGRFPDVHVILYTGGDDADLVEAALDAGASGFMVKAGAPSELVRAMRVALGGQVYVESPLLAGVLARQASRAGTPFAARELQVLGLLGEGRTAGDIARELRLSAATVRSCAAGAIGRLDPGGRLAGSLRLGLLR